MSSQDVPIGVTVGKSSSTSSWPDETLLQSCNLDISTGHVILSFLQEYLDTPEKIADQWNSVADYTNSSAETTIAERAENKCRNVDQSVVPCKFFHFQNLMIPFSDDENIVVLSGTDSNQDGYINASKIFDSDLRQISYIATQSPLENTVVDFWQCIWEQGTTLIVNLNNEQDAHMRYWPDEGAQTYGIFEVSLRSQL
jgi:protein tyrosine phosphatase